ncbi:hypothetical protein L5515_006212 [Caenorhabditis briggsae]|uniref:NADH:flavin oxidoreductase/NADH oxidase N-terminal domain-containing protein n=2 Tax=Caenorhabditis briggsae TaxID=6238 RepID=A0AAE9EVF3_CAEBR|nr:hypothetical protein L5515_006212 [Caenorhabditis briggsae]
MPHQRYNAECVDTKVLTEHIHFRNGRVALNRLMKSPMSEKIYNWEDPHETKRGVPNAGLVNLYEKWGFGGFGIIFTGNLAIDPKHPYEAGQGIVSKENDSPVMRDWYAKMARAMKANHALAIAQLNHPGAWAFTEYTDGSGKKHIISDGPDDILNAPMSVVKSELIDRVVYAAKLLSNCGFDGIEIASAFGNLFCQFLGNNNKRTDEYGGAALVTRTKFHIDLLNAIRREVPAAGGFLVGLKLNSADFQNNFTNDEVYRLCEILDEAGYDFVELTGGQMEQCVQEAQQRASTIARENYFLQFIETVAKSLRKTVVYITGGWQTASGMVNAVKLNITQGVGFARAAANEPDLPRKLLSGVAHATLDNKFSPADYFTSKHAAHFQIKTMAGRSINDVVRPTDGLADFTDEKEAKNFAEKAADYMKFVAADGKPDTFAEVIKYAPIHS